MPHRKPCPTEEEAALIAAIASFWRMCGYAPTYRELRDLTESSSTSVVHYRLSRLRAAGLVDFADDITRTIRLTQRSEVEA